jgi:hypothetical protein
MKTKNFQIDRKRNSFDQRNTHSNGGFAETELCNVKKKKKSKGIECVSCIVRHEEHANRKIRYK